MHAYTDDDLDDAPENDEDIAKKRHAAAAVAMRQSSLMKYFEFLMQMAEVNNREELKEEIEKMAPNKSSYCNGSEFCRFP